MIKGVLVLATASLAVTCTVGQAPAAAPASQICPIKQNNELCPQLMARVPSNNFYDCYNFCGGIFISTCSFSGSCGATSCANKTDDGIARVVLGCTDDHLPGRLTVEAGSGQEEDPYEDPEFGTRPIFYEIADGGTFTCDDKGARCAFRGIQFFSFDGGNGQQTVTSVDHVWGANDPLSDKLKVGSCREPPCHVIGAIPAQGSQCHYVCLVIIGTASCHRRAPRPTPARY